MLGVGGRLFRCVPLDLMLNIMTSKDGGGAVMRKCWLDGGNDELRCCSKPRGDRID